MYPSVTPAQIRFATVADADALAAFGRRSFIDTFADTNPIGNLLAYVDSVYAPAIQQRELLDPAICCLVAVRDSELIAFAQLRRGKMSPGVHDPTAIELQRFYVDRSAHGTGLAQALMDRCLAYASDHGAGTLFLGVWEQNARALRFYAGRGFTEVGRQVFRMGDDEQQDLVLARSLAASDSATA